MTGPSLGSQWARIHVNYEQSSMTLVSFRDTRGGIQMKVTDTHGLCAQISTCGSAEATLPLGLEKLKEHSSKAPHTSPWPHIILSMSPVFPAEGGDLELRPEHSFAAWRTQLCSSLSGGFTAVGDWIVCPCLGPISTMHANGRTRGKHFFARIKETDKGL